MILRGILIAVCTFAAGWLMRGRYVRWKVPRRLLAEGRSQDLPR